MTLLPRHTARRLAAPLLSLSLLGLSAAVPVGLASPGGTRPGTVERPGLATAYGQLPLSFELNQGQADAAVDFVAHGHGYSLSLTGGDAVLSLRQPSTILSIELQAAEPHPEAVGEEPLSGTANYFIGNDPSQWHMAIPTYARVRYRDVYPGIDLMYYGTIQGQLEDDFVVAPGVDPSRIELAFSGTERPTLDVDGALRLSTDAGQIQLQPPVAYQEVAGARVPVPAAYVLSGEQVGFELGAYDSARPLIIDPVLVYSTFLGESFFETPEAIAVDAGGNAYVVGTTGSPNFPTTPGAFQGARAGDHGFVSKLNPTGTALVYSTYLGGSGFDDAAGVAVDAAGNAFVTGATASTDFPTTPGAFQRTLHGPSDAFVTKLNPTGTGLVYSTYLGGSGDNGARTLAINAAGNAYVAGITNSPDFPTTPGAFQTSHPGRNDAFVTELNTTGTGLVSSTYLGGSSDDFAQGLAVDTAGNAYVAGTTDSADFPTTPGAFQPSLRGANDAFVLKLNPTSTGLVYSTYLGPIGNSFGGVSLAVDPAGNAYVAGGTDASDFPVTPGAFQPTQHGFLNAFVSKVNPTGTGLIYSTFLGGSSGDAATAIAVDTSGDAHVTGTAGSVDFPTTPGAFQPTSQGNGDAFVSKLNPTGTGLVYSTFLGGTSNELGRGIAVDTTGHAYVIGATASTDFPITPGAFRSTPGSRSISDADAFVSKIAPGPPGCAIQAFLPGPPTQLQVLVHADQGLASLTPINVSNASVALPTFTSGSTDTLLVTATKIDQTARATFTLHATDVTGASTDCDPALVTIGREPGLSSVQVLHHVARTDSHVTITNGTPGLERVRLQVNGQRFEVSGLKSGERRTLDISSAMRKGSDNTILVVAHGPRHSSAVVLVADS